MSKLTGLPEPVAAPHVVGATPAQPLETQPLAVVTLTHQSADGLAIAAQLASPKAGFGPLSAELLEELQPPGTDPIVPSEEGVLGTVYLAETPVAAFAQVALTRPSQAPSPWDPPRSPEVLHALARELVAQAEAAPAHGLMALANSFHELWDEAHRAGLRDSADFTRDYGAALGALLSQVRDLAERLPFTELLALGRRLLRLVGGYRGSELAAVHDRLTQAALVIVGCARDAIGSAPLEDGLALAFSLQRLVQQMPPPCRHEVVVQLETNVMAPLRDKAAEVTEDHQAELVARTTYLDVWLSEAAGRKGG